MRKKLYYPKSHIITGLQTSGKEWMLEDGTEYVGYYHKYIDGTVLTLADYSPTQSKTLIPYIDKTTQPESRIYDTIAKDTSKYKAPIYKYPIPTESDYKKGFYTRYIIQRRNYLQEIIEIDSEQYSSLNTPDTGIDGNLYKGITLDWKLTGTKNDTSTEKGVEDTNRRLVELKDFDMKGLKQYLTDYLEFTIYSKLVSQEIKSAFGN
jgi:hypothetical protein